MRRGDDELEAKPERDPVVCVWCDAGEVVATPVGPLCRECAQELADDLEADR